MEGEELVDKKPFIKRFWWIGVIIIVVVIGCAAKYMYDQKHQDWRNQPGGGSQQSAINDAGISDQGRYADYTSDKYPACPSDLSGVLTYQLMDPKYIGGMIPLGNVAPPGHTSPVDHIYFSLNADDKVSLYAPANGTIVHVMANSAMEDSTSAYTFDSYVVTYVICRGLVLDFAGYNGISDSLKAELDKHQDACTSGIQKSGHDNAGEQQCDYNNLDFKVTAGEQIGWTQRAKRADGSYNIPFEIWAANYNKPARSDVGWSTYYKDDRYAHSISTFDLYSGALKTQFDSKFGLWQQSNTKDSSGNIVSGTPTLLSRTVAPLSGTVNQDLVGTIQGMWFSRTVDETSKSGVQGSSGQGISVIHYNIDPNQGIIGIGGEMENNLTGILLYKPTHSGTINREPSEVKADGQIYCYQQDSMVSATSNQPINGKILLQLIDDHHIRAEHQSGTCGGVAAFGKAYNFER